VNICREVSKSITGKFWILQLICVPISPTLVNGEFYELDGKSNKMVYIPRGFAHGFSLEDSIFSYKMYCRI
jgi:dTDP-4-dehydrorhamnose 3,5-epimerase